MSWWLTIIWSIIDGKILILVDQWLPFKWIITGWFFYHLKKRYFSKKYFEKAIFSHNSSGFCLFLFFPLLKYFWLKFWQQVTNAKCVDERRSCFYDNLCWLVISSLIEGFLECIISIGTSVNGVPLVIVSLNPLLFFIIFFLTFYL